MSMMSSTVWGRTTSFRTLCVTRSMNEGEFEEKRLVGSILFLANKQSLGLNSIVSPNRMALSKSNTHLQKQKEIYGSFSRFTPTNKHTSHDGQACYRIRQHTGVEVLKRRDVVLQHDLLPIVARIDLPRNNFTSIRVSAPPSLASPPSTYNDSTMSQSAACSALSSSESVPVSYVTHPSCRYRRSIS